MRYEFATCVLDIESHSLTRDGDVQPVEPQVFDLLRLLIENAGDLVTRDQIIDTVWGGRIVSESAVSARVAAARKAVGDDGKRQAIIRTVARRGLQLVVPVITEANKERASESQRLAPSSVPGSRLRYIPGKSGKKLAYMVQGEGSPVLRVDAAGWNIEGEQNSPVWRETAELLARHHCQLRFSTLSLGEADGGPVRIDLDAMAEDIGTLADAAGFERFAILTESGGVHCALRYAARNPNRVSRMVIQGGYVEGRSRRAGSDSSDDVFRHMIEEGWRAEAAPIGAAFMLPYLPEGPLEAIQDAARIFQSSTTREAELALRDAMNTADSSEYLPLVTCPVLVIHGRHDAVHPVSEARRLAEELPDAELWILETANSIPVARHHLWEEYMAGLLDFLARDT